MAGRPSTRRDSKHRVLRGENPSGRMGNTSLNTISTGNHILSTVGDWSRRTNCPWERNHAFPYGNWKSRSAMTWMRKWTRWGKT